MVQATTEVRVPAYEALRERALARWIEWRTEHPLPAADVDEAADYTIAGFDVLSDLLPTDREELLQMALDSRVWSRAFAELDDASETLGDAITDAIASTLHDLACEYDLETRSTGIIVRSAVEARS